MPTLRLWFAVRLGKRLYNSFPSPPGPIFHRWLPDGRNDAIELPVADPNIRMEVWFERRGFMRNDHEVIFHGDRREIDPIHLERQGAVATGLMFGEMVVSNVSESDYQHVLDHVGVEGSGRTDEEYYLDLGKRVYRTLYDAVTRFLDILRYPFGQHWIAVPEPWDSRTYSLGHYLSVSFNLRWHDEENDVWQPFEPSSGPIKGIIFDYGDLTPFWEFIAKEDWEAIRDLAIKGYEPSIAATVLSRAHELRDDGNMRHALIEGVTALEIAIGERLDQYLKVSPALEKASAQLRSERGIRTRLSAALVGHQINHDDILLVLDAIDIRNAVIHKSANLPSDADRQVDALLRVTATLLDGPVHRFPYPMNTGGAWQSPEQWAKDREEWEAAKRRETN